jgi:hypothetical protein
MKEEVKATAPSQNEISQQDEVQPSYYGVVDRVKVGRDSAGQDVFISFRLVPGREDPSQNTCSKGYVQRSVSQCQCSMQMLSAGNRALTICNSSMLISLTLLN